MNYSTIDILEEDIIKDFSKEVLEILLCEHAYEKIKGDEQTNHHIFWATDIYEEEGNGFQFADEIQIENITGKYNKIIRPRVAKSKEEQGKRTRDKAEVFTPSWVCNAQNNLIDNAWFGRKNVFNKEFFKNGKHYWTPSKDKIIFDNKTWQEYVSENRLEMACGEGPYLVSRYDTTTGETIEELSKRIGLLDRKFRIVSENVKTLEEWYKWAFIALKSTYGFEWQGDSLLLAREAILYTFIDYYKEFTLNHEIEKSIPEQQYVQQAAKIISWNLFQMDGIKMVLPLTCHDEVIKGEMQLSLFEEVESKDTIIECEGCKKNDVHKHNGIKQVVAEWNKNDWDFDEQPIEIVEFHTLLNK